MSYSMEEEEEEEKKKKKKLDPIPAKLSTKIQKPFTEWCVMTTSPMK